MAHGPSPAWSFAQLAGEPAAQNSAPILKVVEVNNDDRLTVKGRFSLPVTNAAQTTLKPAIEKAFLHPLDPNLIAISPQRKLVAVVTGDKQVECFRFNGSRAFWHKRSTYATVAALSWLKHKDYLQLVWSDGKLEIIDSTTGRPHRTAQLRPENDLDDESPLLCFATTTYKTQASGTPNTSTDARLGQSRNEVEDFVSQMVSRSSSPSTLPREIGWYDLQEELPRLSVLPIASEDSAVPRKIHHDTFTKQALLNDLASKPYSHDQLGNSFGLSVGVWANGQLAFLDASSEVLRGSYQLDDGVPFAEPFEEVDETIESTDRPHHILTHIKHASHESSPYQAFYTDNGTRHTHLSSPQLLVFLKFGEIEESAVYLNQLNFMLKRLETLSGYTLQIIINIRSIYQGWRRLPGAWISAAKEMFDESSSKLDFAAALYRFAVTGDMVGVLREWVKEWIAPSDSMKNFERWRDAIHDGYTNILDELHNCFLPAIDRAAVVASRLRVLNRTPSVALFSVEDKSFEHLTESLDILRLLGHAILDHTARESRQFDAFSPWLSTMIQFANSEPGGQAAQESEAKLAQKDLVAVLAYITGPLGNSRLERFFGQKPVDVVAAAREDTDVSMHNVKAVLIQDKKHGLDAEDGEPYEIDPLYHAVQWHDDLEEMVQSVTSNFVASIKRERLVGRTPSFMKPKDMKMIVETPGPDPIVKNYIASVPEDKDNRVVLSCVTIKPRTSSGNNVSGPETSWTWIQTHLIEGRVTDICFVDDNFYIILLRMHDESRLIKLPYNLPPSLLSDSKQTKAIKKYFARCIGGPRDVPAVTEGIQFWTQSPAIIAHSTIFSFVHELGGPANEFVPKHLVYVEGKLVVLSEDRKRMRVFFDLDVVDEEDFAPQGNPTLDEQEAGMEYWKD